MNAQTMDEFLAYFESVRGRTRRVVMTIPPDRIEWTPRAGGFTLGDLVRHIAATERDMWAETVCGRPSRYAGYGRELADGFDAVVAYFDRSHAETVALLVALPAEALDAKCWTPAGATLSARKWLRAMLEHEIHHRGQIYFMLGMLGVPTPPLFGLTEPQVRERSAGR